MPIRLQVGRQIAMLIAAGKLRPGEPLPSIRALANRLRIHYNTVSQAYQDLVDYHLVERHRGSRMIVRSSSSRSGENAALDLDDVINSAIQLAKDHGYTLQQPRHRVRERLLAQPPDHLLVVSDELGLGELLRAELEQQVGCPVAACSLTDLSANRALAIGALVVGPPGNIEKAAQLLPKDRSPFLITFSTAEQYVALVRKLKEPSAIAVVSLSKIFLRTARGLLAPALGCSHTLREYFLPSEKPGDLNAFSIVFCDSIARHHVNAARLVHYRLISPACLKQLASGIKFGSSGASRT